MEPEMCGNHTFATGAKQESGAAGHGSAAEGSGRGDAVRKERALARIAAPTAELRYVTTAIIAYWS